MKSLSIFMKEYLTTRRALGFKLDRTEHELKQFLRFLKRKKSSVILSQTALEWATHSGSTSRENGANRLSYVIQFARYVSAEDPRHEVPSQCLVPYPKRRRKPIYIYSEKEILKLMEATQIFRSLLKSRNYRVLIGLLAATGMRVGELIALDDKDFDSVKGLLTVRKSKEGQSRLILLHSSTRKELKSYQKFRDQAVSKSSTALFRSNSGARLHYENVHPVFDRLLKEVLLYERKPKPRIHDLRHTFIIKTIERWYHEGKRVESKLSYLSTYVGHVSPSSTYWYLSATPELMACAAKLLNQRMEVLS